MRIVYVQDNIFRSTTSLAHTVCIDFYAKGGIAKGFIDNFGAIDELQSQRKRVGEVAMLVDKNRYIFYLVVKQKYYYTATYSGLAKCLIYLRDMCLCLGVREISMPKVGCSYDMLSWDMVSALISSIFEDTDIVIYIYSL